MQFTKEQSAVINSEPEGNILVSASAGSGKTRVLVERVIRKIKQGTDIDQLLIVTFTKAAAKEMKDRIQKALQSAINDTHDEQSQRHLLRQIRKLPVADISTLDAFCQRLVQRYYYVIDMDPEFRLLTDATEVQILRDQVWEKVRENLYTSDAKDSQHRFTKLVANFSNDRSDDNLTDLVYRLYDFANVNQDPQKWLLSLSKHYQVGDSLTDSELYNQFVLPEIKERLQQMILIYQNALAYAQTAEADLEKETAYLNDELKIINTLLNSLEDYSWNDLRDRFAHKIVEDNFPRGKKDEKEFHKVTANFNSEARDIWKKQISDRYFQDDEDTNLAIIKDSRQIVQTLVKVVLQFSSQYHQLKLQRRGLEFIDIEHAAYQILAKAEQSSEVRTSLQQRYQEIMVDEYQDNNRLQDAILNQVARKNSAGESKNMFMVGDVKQSIYRFRLSDPSIFLSRHRAYQKSDNQNLNIDLADNFRSAENIDNFVNLIFEQIMDERVGNIDYTGAAKLKFGAKYYPDDLDTKVEMMLYDSSDDDEQTVNEQFQVSDAAHGQMELVAQKIQKLVEGHHQIYDRDLQTMRDVKYSDIAILSATRNQNLVLADVFSQHEIPLTISGSQSYFKTTEIQIMMALLRIIDNPYQDIPLVAVLRSPIVGLTENQLSYIRINRNTGDYFQAIQYFAKHYSEMSDSKGYGDRIHSRIVEFLKQLADFTNYAHQHEIVDLIWYIYQKTGFLDYVGGMPAGDQRQLNLHALYQRAAEYEKTSFKGLFQFVRFIERMQKHDQDLAEPQQVADDNIVQAMTIHGSKGLEFPVVFLIDLQHQFNNRETSQSYVLDDRLGIGIDYVDQRYRTKYPTLLKQVVTDQIKSDSQAEEMRKLYVALTRAEQKLFLVAAVKKDSGETDLAEHLSNKWGSAQFSFNLVLDDALRTAQNSDLKWFGIALYRHPMFTDYLSQAVVAPVLLDDHSEFKIQLYDVTDLDIAQHTASGSNGQQKNWLKTLQSQSIDVDHVSGLKQIKHIMDFKYKNQAATHTTAYQAVSEVKRLFDDPDTTDMGFLTGNFSGNVKQSNRYLNTSFATPQFLQTINKPTPAEIGTATHLVLQKVDVATMPTADQIEHLIQKLVKQGIITAEVAKAISVQSILKLFSSDLGQLILQHPDRLHREVPFSLILSAKDLFADFPDDNDDKILIHGIIDGYLTLDDEIVLFDYKTDYLNPNHPDQQIEKLKNKYRGQVNLYALALQKILHQPIQHRYLYSLSINQLIKVIN